VTRKQVWLQCGNAFATPLSKRNKWLKWVTDEGLCSALALTVDPRMNGHDSRWELIQRQVSSLKNGRYSGVLWLPDRFGLVPGWTPECDDIRALFAYLMAELSDEEYAELVADK
jgi:hypothetical protein